VSLTGPHVAPRSVHDFGTQAELPPQTLGVPPPPQLWGGVQAPHWRMPPQPSLTGPQLAPSVAQVRRPQPPPSGLAMGASVGGKPPSGVGGT
jgi:hypothetical protein